MVFTVLLRRLRPNVQLLSNFTKFNHGIYNLTFLQRNFATKVFKLSDIGEGITEVELVKWDKDVGDEVEEMESVCTVQSDKAAVEITSRFSGKVEKLYHKPGDIVKVGDPLMDIDVQDDEAVASVINDSSNIEIDTNVYVKDNPTVDNTGIPKNGATPGIRKLAKELGVDISKVSGTGPNGQITEDDLNKANKSSSNQPETTVVKLSGIPLAMAKAMVQSMEIPAVTIGMNIDFTDLIKKAKSVTEAYGFKVTVTPLIIKIFSLAMDKHPIFNSKFGPINQYTLYKNHNISVAIATENGLLVPNIKEVQNKNIKEINDEMNRLQKLATNNKLSLNDITKGTFSISNLGSIGCSTVIPRLFDGQAAIAGITSAELVPRYIGDDIKPRRIAQIGLTADHRHIDGAAMALFLTDVKRLVENPDQLDQFI